MLVRAAVAAAAVVAATACAPRPTLTEPAPPTVPSTTTTVPVTSATTTRVTAPPTTTPPPTTATPQTLPAPAVPPSPSTVPPETLPPSTAPPGPVEVPGGLYLIGDSVMLGARTALLERFPGAVVDATESRSFGAGIDVIRRLGRQGELPANVVIHLGANGAVTPAQCDQMMDALAGHRVLLLTIKVPRTWETPNNEVLRGCATTRGVALVDWYAAANANPAAFYKDGIHLRPPQGGLLYANLVDDAL